MIRALLALAALAVAGIAGYGFGVYVWTDVRYECGCDTCPQNSGA